MVEFYLLITVQRIEYIFLAKTERWTMHDDFWHRFPKHTIHLLCLEVVGTFFFYFNKIVLIFVSFVRIRGQSSA